MRSLAVQVIPLLLATVGQQMHMPEASTVLGNFSTESQNYSAESLFLQTCAEKFAQNPHDRHCCGPKGCGQCLTGWNLCPGFVCDGPGASRRRRTGHSDRPRDCCGMAECHVPKTCYCEHGTTAIGDSCLEHRMEICTSCDSGYHLEEFVHEALNWRESGFYRTESQRCVPNESNCGDWRCVPNETRYESNCGDWLNAVTYNTSPSDACRHIDMDACRTLAVKPILGVECCEGLCAAMADVEALVQVLFGINLADMLVNFVSIIVMCCVFVVLQDADGNQIALACTGGILALVFRADLALQIAAVVVTKRATPLVMMLSEASCFNLAVDREPDRILLSLFADLEKTMVLGVVELVVAAVGSIADFCGLFNSTAMLVAIVLALFDVVLSIVDFTVLSVSAKEQADVLFGLVESGGPEMCISATFAAEKFGKDMVSNSPCTGLAMPLLFLIICIHLARLR